MIAEALVHGGWSMKEVEEEQPDETSEGDLDEGNHTDEGEANEAVEESTQKGKQFSNVQLKQIVNKKQEGETQTEGKQGFKKQNLKISIGNEEEEQKEIDQSDLMAKHDKPQEAAASEAESEKQVEEVEEEDLTRSDEEDQDETDVKDGEDEEGSTKTDDGQDSSIEPKKALKFQAKKLKKKGGKESEEDKISE
jgi:hypothetical protein